MIAALIRLQILQAKLAAQRGMQDAYDSQQRAIKDAADHQELYDAIERAEYGRDAIDVEVREVVDVVLIEDNAPPPRDPGGTQESGK